MENLYPMLGMFLVAFTAIAVWEGVALLIGYMYKDKLMAKLKPYLYGQRDQSYRSKEGIEMLSTHLATQIDQLNQLKENVQVLDDELTKTKRLVTGKVSDVLSGMRQIQRTVENQKASVDANEEAIEKLKNSKASKYSLKKLTGGIKKDTTRVTRSTTKPKKGK